MDIILLARTEAHESHTIDNATIHYEYRVRLLSNDERDQHAKDYGASRLYSMKEVWVFEKGTIWKQDNEIIKETWNTFDWADSAEQAAKGSTETAYLTAESLHYLHQDAVKYYCGVNILKTKIDGLEFAIRALGNKYNDLYEQALKKKRLYSKAQKDQAPQAVIAALKVELHMQYDAEKITLQVELDTAQTALKEIMQ